MHLVGYIWECICDARTHERQSLNAIINLKNA